MFKRLWELFLSCVILVNVPVTLYWALWTIRYNRSCAGIGHTSWEWFDSLAKNPVTGSLILLMLVVSVLFIWPALLITTALEKYSTYYAKNWEGPIADFFIRRWN